MVEIQIKLAALWVIVMLIYLLGDVLRIFSGNVTLGEINGQPWTQGMLLGIAVLMVTPILMIFISLTSEQPLNRWMNIIAAVGWFGFNLVGLPTYSGWYDRFLLAMSMVFNVISVWYAWNWM